jgi:hypothetical protein
MKDVHLLDELRHAKMVREAPEACPRIAFLGHEPGNAGEIAPSFNLRRARILGTCWLI